MSPRITSGSSKGLTVRLTTCSDPFVLTLSPFMVVFVFSVIALRMRIPSSNLKTLSRHGIDVQIRFSDRWFQVFPRTSGEVEDVTLVIDEHNRRSDSLEDERLGDFGDAGIGFFLCTYDALRPDFKGQPRCGEFDQFLAGDRCLPALEDLPFVVPRREEIGEASY